MPFITWAPQAGTYEVAVTLGSGNATLVPVQLSTCEAVALARRSRPPSNASCNAANTAYFWVVVVLLVAGLAAWFHVSAKDLRLSSRLNLPVVLGTLSVFLYALGSPAFRESSMVTGADGYLSLIHI